MKQKLLFLAVLCSMGITVNTQTLYVPNGTSGIGTSSNGNVGIGIPNPETTLDINGSTMLRGWDAVLSSKNGDGSLFQLIGTYYGWNKNAIYIAGYNAANDNGYNTRYVSFGGWRTERLWVDLMSGNVGIGTTSPQSQLEISQYSPDNFIWLQTLRNSSNTSTSTGKAGVGLKFALSTKDEPAKWAGIGAIAEDVFGNQLGLSFYTGVSNQTERVRISNSGNVGIGTSSPDEKLTVNGIVHAKEVRVDLTGALADYVFSKDYSLMPLHKVEQYVKTNSHLPDVPSATEIKDKGLSMGEMQNKLLQKIEELTLYAINQNKQLSQQNKKIAQLENEIQAMKK